MKTTHDETLGLYSRIVKVNMDKTKRVTLSQSELLSAIQKPDLDRLKELVEQGADIHADDEVLLRWAVFWDRLPEIKYLVEQGADIHARNEIALHWASCYGLLPIVKYLVEQGANVSADNNFALRLAIKHEQYDVVNYLTELTGGQS